ncbi:MAG TPA: hypothetical protein VM580_11930 [Labilithrix sp.]|jgi:hypothetical protein|nr:hypothetical protein [Labilithrix sp.]
MSERRKIGPHELWREADTGLVGMTTVGMVEENHAIAILATVKDFTESLGPDEPFLMLADARQAGGVSSGARRIYATQTPTGRPAYVSIFGVTFMFRVALQLVFKAIAIASSNKFAVRIEETEADARAWLLKQAAEWRAGKRSNASRDSRVGE